MKIIYFLKGDPKPYVYRGSLKEWKQKIERLEHLEKWEIERRSTK